MMQGLVRCVSFVRPSLVRTSLVLPQQPRVGSSFSNLCPQGGGGGLRFFHPRSCLPKKKYKNYISDDDVSRHGKNATKKQRHSNTASFNNNNNNKNSNRSLKQSAIARNKQIVALGKQRDWHSLLGLYQAQGAEFNHVNYATTLSQLGRMASPSFHPEFHPGFGKLLKDLAGKLHTHGLQWIGIRQLANIIHALGKLQEQCGDAKSAKRIVAFAVQPKVMELILQEGDTQSFSHICWALAKLNDQKSFLEAWKHVGAYPDWLLHQGDAQAISTVAYACATLGIPSAHTVFEAIERYDPNRWVQRANTRSVANTAWAAATLGLVEPARPFLQAIEDHADELVLSGNPHDVAHMAWAMATLNFKAPKFSQAIQEHAAWLVAQGSPQDLANTAWACGHLRIPSMELFQHIGRRSSWLIQNGTPQHVANVAWACATLGHRVPAIFHAIDQATDKLMDHGDPRDIAIIAWSCATLGLQAPKLFLALEEQAPQLLANGNPQNVANLAWAFCALGLRSHNLFVEIARHADNFMAVAPPESVACTALAFVNVLGGSSQDPLLNQAKHQFFQSLRSILPMLIPESNAQSIVNLCYAFALLDMSEDPQSEHLYGDCFRQLWEHAVHNIDPNELGTEAWSQLLQSQAYAASVSSKQSSSNFLIPKRLHAPQDASRPTYTSRAQREVSSILSDLGFPHEQEVSPFTADSALSSKFGSSLPPGMLAIDMASKERMVAIEFDGPFHYLRDVASGRILDVENGATSAKRRFLEQLGWKVINIRYQDWNRAGTTQEMQHFLASELDGVL